MNTRFGENNLFAAGKSAQTLDLRLRKPRIHKAFGMSLTQFPRTVNRFILNVNTFFTRNALQVYVCILMQSVAYHTDYLYCYIIVSFQLILLNLRLFNHKNNIKRRDSQIFGLAELKTKTAIFQNKKDLAQFNSHKVENWNLQFYLLQKHTIDLFFQMRTSQIKNYALQKTIKLKLDNKLSPEYFTPEDSKKVEKVCESLKEVRQQQKCLSDHILQLNCQLMTKLRNFIKSPQRCEQQDENKIRFRVAKSSKKGNKNLQNNQYLPEIQDMKTQRLKPLAPFSENRSQLIFRKENYNFEQQPKQQNTIKKVNVKKLPKLVGQRINDMQYVPIQLSQQQVKQVLPASKPKQKDQQKQIQTMKQRQIALTQQNKKLRSMLRSLQGSQKEIKNQCQQIDFKIFLSFEEVTANAQEKKQPVVKVEILKQEKGIKQARNEGTSKKDDCIRVRYLEDLVSHLQLLIVSQNQQIESLRSKLVASEKKPEKQSQNSKSGRWNAY